MTIEELRLEVQEFEEEYVVVSTLSELGSSAPGDFEGLAVVFRHEDPFVCEAWMRGALWGVRETYRRLGIRVEEFLREDLE